MSRVENREGEEGKILTSVDLSCSAPCTLRSFRVRVRCMCASMRNASAYQREPECVAIANGLAGLDGPVINCVTHDYITDAADPLYYIQLYVRVAGGLRVRYVPLPSVRVCRTMEETRLYVLVTSRPRLGETRTHPVSANPRSQGTSRIQMTRAKKHLVNARRPVGPPVRISRAFTCIYTRCSSESTPTCVFHSP